MQIKEIARVAHEVNRAYCKAIGDPEQPAWEDAPDWLQLGVIRGVRFHLDHPEASPEDSHAKWLEDRTDQGWTLGPKDVELKTHPNMLPWAQLPEDQRVKDHLFRAIVRVCNYPGA
jgi:RyR domain